MSERSDASDGTTGVAEERGMTTETWVFAGIGLFFLAAATLYWFTSYEDAGTTMLTLAGGLGLLTGGYLWAQARKLEAAEPEEERPAAPETEPASAADPEPGPEEPWFPHASVWPFAVGLAAFLVANGLLLGRWALIPAAAMLAAAVVGYAAQSRTRS